MSNGYEIRLELLRMAKDILAQRYNEECAKARLEFENNLTSTLVYPEKITMTDIIAEAVQLNKFINQKN
jgi:hypothetical protein